MKVINYQFNRIIEVDDDNAIAKCRNCNDTIYEGEELLMFEEMELCSNDCLISVLEKENLLVRT